MIVGLRQVEPSDLHAEATDSPTLNGGPFQIATHSRLMQLMQPVNDCRMSTNVSKISDPSVRL